MLIRVLEIPRSSGRFHFGGGEPQTFVQVDWFRDDHAPISTQEDMRRLEEFIRGKRYFDPAKAYLILHPTHPMTINYEAP